MGIFNHLSKSRKPERPPISEKLASASDPEERAQIFERDILGYPEDFAKDCQEVAKTLNQNDREALISHGSRHIGERATARAATIRQSDTSGTETSR